MPFIRLMGCTKDPINRVFSKTSKNDGFTWPGRFAETNSYSKVYRFGSVQPTMVLEASRRKTMSIGFTCYRGIPGQLEISFPCASFAARS